MFNRLQKIGAWSGLLSSLGMLLSYLIVGFAYRGRIGEGFSLANHFVSELGEVGISELAWLFNAALVIGGLGILLSFIALASYLHGWFRWLVLVLGLITGVSATLVGFFPMNQLEIHISIALAFFNTGWMVTGAFSFYVLFAKQSRFPKWLAIPGMIAAVAFIAFSTYNDSFMDSFRDGTSSLSEILGAARPAFWGLAALEWVVVLAVLLWVALVSAVMLTQEEM